MHKEAPGIFPPPVKLELPLHLNRVDVTENRTYDSYKTPLDKDSSVQLHTCLNGSYSGNFLSKCYTPHQM
jgi:hypothetical protein